MILFEEHLPILMENSEMSKLNFLDKNQTFRMVWKGNVVKSALGNIQSQVCRRIVYVFAWVKTIASSFIQELLSLLILLRRRRSRALAQKLEKSFSLQFGGDSVAVWTSMSFFLCKNTLEYHGARGNFDGFQKICQEWFFHAQV